MENYIGTVVNTPAGAGLVVGYSGHILHVAFNPYEEGRFATWQVSKA